MERQQRQFEALVNAYSGDLYRYAFWMCRNSTLAEDLVQETFLRAWKALHSLEDYQAAKSWLLMILRRETARYFERNKQPLISLQDINLDTLELGPTGMNPNSLFVLRQGLAQLPHAYREPLLLQVLGGLSCEEIADCMAIKPGAVMTRLFRARQKLQQWYAGENDTEVENRKV